MPPLVALVLIGIAVVPSWAAADCADPKPILSVFWEELPAPPGDTVLGAWRLPISSAEPEVITHARVDAKLARAGADWRIALAFSFPDPEPYGIPFTFQRVIVERESAEGRRVAVLDWSFGCAGPGRSLFPGQRFDVAIPIGEPEGLDDPDGFARLSIRLWGSRN